MKTARQVVAETVMEWLERSDIEANFTEIQRLEVETQIWEWGKWCSRTGLILGYAPQIHYRGDEYPESSEWDALRDLSDDEGMRISQAAVGLNLTALDVLKRIYQLWQSDQKVRQRLDIGQEALDLIRLSALRHIKKRLKHVQRHNIA